jgi:hypothetical protein
MNITLSVNLVKNASHTCAMLSEAYGRKAMKSEVFLSGINSSKGAHMSITNEDNAHHFLRYEGSCSF